jgi:hypothetical protein
MIERSPVRGYVGAVVPGLYRVLFAAIAATAGSLTGLLFVALSGDAAPGPGGRPPRHSAR